MNTERVSMHRVENAYGKFTVCMNIFNPFKPEKELIVTFLVNVNKYLYAVHHNNTLCSVTNCFFYL